MPVDPIGLRLLCVATGLVFLTPVIVLSHTPHSPLYLIKSHRDER